MPFDQAIVIGTGRVACGCIDALREQTKFLAAVEAERQPFSAVSALCARVRADYTFLADPAEVSAYFAAITAPSLVVSAHNRYIFPPSVLANDALTVVNFHNSLLPRHAGRNAPTWAIFEGDETGGVTWHEVSVELDRGSVISQRTTEITHDDTGFSLTRRSADLGIAAFREIVTSLMAGAYRVRTQAADPSARRHRSTEMPNGGWLDTAWNSARMSAFLRAVDYGKLRVFPAPRVLVGSAAYEVRGYRIVGPGGEVGGGDALVPGARRAVFEDEVGRAELTLV